MKHVFKLSIVILILTISLPATLHANSQAGTFKYAYVTYTRSTFPAPAVTLYSIDPANPGTQTALYTLPVPDYTPPYYLSLSKATPSPDGKWIALIYTEVYGGGGAAAEIMLVNVATGEHRMLTELPVVLYENDDPMLDYLKLAVWSPDSRYLALNFYVSDGEIAYGGPGALEGSTQLHTTYFLYSVETGKLISSSPDAIPASWSTWIAWSKDSTRFVVAAATPIVANDGYKISLDVYDVAQMSRRTSIAIPDPSNSLSLPTALCRLAWSPDGRYLSFIMDCDSSNFVYKNVYVADIETGKVSQLTDYKILQGVSPDDLAGSYPEPMWYDANTLLVSVAVWRGQGGQTHTEEMTAYRLPLGTPTVVDQQWITTLTRNPLTKEIAYFPQTFSSNTGSINGSFTISTLQIATFDAGNLTPILNLPADGGQLDWSPDGAILAYIPWRSAPVSYQTEQGTLTANLWDTTFIDNSSGRITRFTPPVDKQTETDAVGWIFVP